MFNMLTLEEFYNTDKDYYDRIGNSDFIQKLHEYGLENAIADIFLRKNVTGISNLNELFDILSNINDNTYNVLTSAKRRYLGSLLMIYGTSEELYESLGITDQDIDTGSPKAMKTISQYIIDQNNKTSFITR